MAAFRISFTDRNGVDVKVVDRVRAAHPNFAKSAFAAAAAASGPWGSEAAPSRLIPMPLITTIARRLTVHRMTRSRGSFIGPDIPFSSIEGPTQAVYRLAN